MPNPSPQTFFVLFHSPGDNWLDGLPFREQPGVVEHVQYMAGFMASNQLVMGGPFMDNSGGMMMLDCPTKAEADQIAHDDPTVKNGLLRVEVKEWYVPMMRGE